MLTSDVSVLSRGALPLTSTDNASMHGEVDADACLHSQLHGAFDVSAESSHLRGDFVGSDGKVGHDIFTGTIGDGISGEVSLRVRDGDLCSNQHAAGWIGYDAKNTALGSLSHKSYRTQQETENKEYALQRMSP